MNEFNDKGERHGLWENYLPNGQLSFRTEYFNDKRHGFYEEYSEDKLRWKGEYQNGERHGLWERYYTNGQLEFRAKFQNGTEIGICEVYQDNVLSIQPQ